MKTFHAVAAGGIEVEDEEGIRRAVPVDELDRRFAEAVGSALRRGIPIAIVVPVAGTTAALAAAVTAALRLLVRRRSGEVRVMVVSSRLGLRSALDRTRLGGERLTETLPRCAIHLSGELRQIGRHREVSPGWIAFTSDVALAEGASPDVVVVDGDDRRADAEMLARVASGSALVYTTSSPFDPILRSLETFGGAVVAFGRGDLAAYSGGSTGLVAPAWLSAVARSGRHELVGPASSGFDDALADLWSTLGSAQREVGRADDLAFAWGTAGALGQLAVPVMEHDRASHLDPWAQPLSNSVERARAFAQNATGSAREALHSVANSIEAALEAALLANRKPAVLAELVGEEVAAGRPFVVATRSRAASVATATYLDELPGVPLGWRDLGRVTTAKRLLLEGPRSRERTAVVTGPLARAYVGLVPVPPAGRLLVLVAGSWERQRARRQIEQATTLASSLARDESARRTTTRLGIEQMDADLIEPSIEDRETGGVKGRSVRHGPAWDPFDVQIVGPLGDREPDLEGRLVDDRIVDVIAVRTVDGTLFVEPDRLVSRIRDGEEREVAAKSLHAGDSLVLVDATARIDLFTLIAARAQELPELQPVVLLVDDWHLRARAAPHRLGRSNEEILSAMAGTSITSPATIGSWIRGEVHGPEDPADIGRFARAVGDEVLERRADATARAVETLRRYRRRLGMMLASATATGETNGWLDARLGIHFLDLASTLSTHLVVGVDLELRSMAASFTGKLHGDGACIREEMSWT